jgi:hypothetical protein
LGELSNSATTKSRNDITTVPKRWRRKMRGNNSMEIRKRKKIHRKG